MKRFIRISCFFFFVFAIQIGNAQKLIVINDNTKEFILQNDYLEVLEDKNGSWTIDDILSPKLSNQFKVNSSNYPYNENINSAYWVRFKVKNNSIKGKNFLLESYAPHTNNWDVYIFDGEKYILKKSGLNIALYEREYVNKNLILDMPIDTGKVYTFYARVFSQNHSSFDYRIKPLNYFFFYSVNEYYFLGIYYGIMLIMAIYNLLIYFSLREKVYIYYVLYVVSGILTSLSDDSIGNQYVWVNQPEFNSIIGSLIAPSLLLLTFVLYSREFLHLSEKYPKYDKVVIGITIGYFVYYISKFFILPEYLYFQGLYIIPFIVVYYLAIKIYSLGYKPARYIIVGFGFILVSIIIIKLRSNGSIEGNLFTVYSFNYGLVLEVLVLSFALAERVKYAKKEKEDALRERNNAQFEVIKQLRINEKLKDTVNRELEQKVEERTKELHEKNTELEHTNIKLQEMTEKANLMSMKLDADNWNLQKKILESIRDRMLGQEVTYDEFNKLFPDETACYRYLYELKWGKDYCCRRCNSESSSTEEKLFAKKCSKCGYIESVTAHTIFHAIKFPINKAFYIVYLILYNQEKMTLNEMAELLDLRKNTGWKFKQKVLLAIEIYEKKNAKRLNHELGNKWEAIIFNDYVMKKNMNRYSKIKETIFK